MWNEFDDEREMVDGENAGRFTLNEDQDSPNNAGNEDRPVYDYSNHASGSQSGYNNDENIGLHQEESVSEEVYDSVSEMDHTVENRDGISYGNEADGDTAAEETGSSSETEQGSEVPSSFYHYTYTRGEKATFVDEDLSGIAQSGNTDQQDGSRDGTQESYAGSPQQNYRGSADQAYQPYKIQNAVVKKEKKNKKFWKKIASAAVLAAVFGIVASVTFRVTDAVGNRLFASAASEEELGTEQSDLLNTISGDSYQVQKVNTVTDVSEIVDNVMPSIVAITNVSVQEVQSMFGFYSQPIETESSGSGIIVGKNDNELLIATNNHVVSSATTLSVCFNDNFVAEAIIKGTDADVDLAVIAVELSDIPQENLDNLSIADLGDSTALNVGEPAIAIGNALGYGQSVTLGVISALEREVTVDNMTNSLIQTDAAINPGNSGGALLNMRGEVIGINAVKYAASGVEGMGYAIPVNTALPILNDLMARETRSVVDESQRSYLGIVGVNVSEEAMQMYGMPSGLYLNEVVEGSPAESAGLNRGDIITKFDGTNVTTQEALQELMGYYAAGEEVDVTIQYLVNGKYEEKVVTVTLGARPTE